MKVPVPSFDIDGVMVKIGFGRQLLKGAKGSTSALASNARRRGSPGDCACTDDTAIKQIMADTIAWGKRRELII